MNEQNEIRGDEIEDARQDHVTAAERAERIITAAERIDAFENSPEPHPPTQAELEDMFRDWESRQDTLGN